MARDSLLDFFEDFSTRDDVFLVHDDGYRVRQLTYRQVAAAARSFAERLQAAGVSTDDKVVIWSENRIEWVIALWGTLLASAVLVPVDYRASVDLVSRITAIVDAKLVLVGDVVETLSSMSRPIWKLGGIDGTQNPGTSEPGRRVTRDVWNPLAQIIFTSGATADPKGVTITHRNVLANIIPIEREIAKYRRLIRPFHPIRFLNLLPLSHMFGQSMTTFVPPMLGGTVVFSHGYSPAEIIRQIHARRVSVLVCVPKVLHVLREHVERIAPMTAGVDPLPGKHWAWRWWRYRQVHRLFGYKFGCIVCGAAPLEPELEAFWRKLGFLVVQGYGLTETAPIVTLNHPFRASKGTVGKPIGGVQVRIADDGEILVRGENVTAGYYQPDGGPAPDSSAFRDGWFHTGDIGELDAEGRLHIKGRKKEMIVTPQGLNVFPEDVERALLVQPGVRDAAVVGVPVDGEERIHAILVLHAAADMDEIVRGANARLEDHQRVWSSARWPGDALPRTEGTQKLKRKDLQRWASGERGTGPARATGGTSLEEIIGRYTANRTISDVTTLEELGLSSLDRVELMMALEEAFQTTLDESALAGPRTVGELRAELSGSSTPSPDTVHRIPGTPTAVAARRAQDLAGGPIDFPSWNRSSISWLVRRASLATWILPLGRPFMKTTVEGLEHLLALEGPVVFAANHQSHLDTPAILIALPPKWRYRLAPAMAKEFFKAHFNRRDYGWKAWVTNSLNYYLSAQFFNAFPLPQREAGTRQTLRYIGEVTADGYSVLIFPEGKRTQQGEIISFRPGIGMIGARLNLPIVPVRLEGLEKVLHQKMKWPVRGPVRVAFGAPLHLEGDDYAALAKQVEDAVRAL